MSFITVVEEILKKISESSAKKGAFSTAVNPFPTDPTVGKWMAVFVDIEEVARITGVVLPQAAIIANDMEMLEPFMPYLIKIAENGKPIQPGDLAYELPAGNPDAYKSGSDNASGP